MFRFQLPVLIPGHPVMDSQETYPKPLKLGPSMDTSMLRQLQNGTGLSLHVIEPPYLINAPKQLGILGFPWLRTHNTHIDWGIPRIFPMKPMLPCCFMSKRLCSHFQGQNYCFLTSKGFPLGTGFCRRSLTLHGPHHFSHINPISAALTFSLVWHLLCSIHFPMPCQYL